MTAEDEFNKVLLDIMKQETSPEAVRAKNMLLMRMATENQVMPTRIPQPMNITEIGGYLNLLEKLGHRDLQYGTLASILGQPHQSIETEFYDRVPVVFFTEYITDRPECRGVKEIPLTFVIRSDFSAPFTAMLNALHRMDAALPIFSQMPQLPAVGTMVDEGTLMEMIGRRIEIAPSAVMNDPKTDPVIVTRRDLFVRCGGEASTVDALSSNGKIIEIKVPLIHLNPLLAQSGWHPSAEGPTTLTNTTGLVRGRTKYGDELGRIYTGAQIAASSVRDMIQLTWNGRTFAPDMEVL